MKSSNLAQRLEEFESTLDSLRLTSEPATRMIVAQDPPSAERKKPQRRAGRIRAIEIRDQGLRSFRVF
jgi:hypothetical protein